MSPSSSWLPFDYVTPTTTKSLLRICTSKVGKKVNPIYTSNWEQYSLFTDTFHEVVHGAQFIQHDKFLLIYLFITIVKAYY